MSVLQEKNRNLAYVSVSLAETATKFCVFGPSTTTSGHSFCSYCGKCTWIVDVDLRRKAIRGTHITPPNTNWTVCCPFITYVTPHFNTFFITNCFSTRRNVTSSLPLDPRKQSTFLAFLE